MTDKIKLGILRKIQDSRDKKISPDVETFQKEGFDIGTIRAMVSEGLINLYGPTLSLTTAGDKVLRENLTIEILSKQQEKMSLVSNSFVSQYKSIQNSLESTLKATKFMQDIAGSLNRLSFPIRDIQSARPLIKQIQEESKVFSQIAKTQEWASKLGWLAEISQLSKLALTIPKIPILNMPLMEITLPIINQSQGDLDQLSEDIGEDLDPVYNVEAYEVLFSLEVYLRKLIHKRIILKFLKQIEDKIHPSILKKWKERKQEEQSNKYIDHLDYNLIEYSDFTDLKGIFEKGKNKKLFEDIVSEADFDIILSKLHELDPIRKKIAHSRLLSKNEFEMIKLYYDQIIKIISTQNGTS